MFRAPGEALSASASKDEVERRPLAHGALRPSSSAMPVDDPAYRGQPDASAWEFALAVQALEGTEKLVPVDHVEADPIVAHEGARLAIHQLAPDLDRRGPLLARELPCVVDQVADQDAHQASVARHG